VQQNSAFVADDPSNFGMKNLLSDLQRLIRQPSISSENAGLEECASIVEKIMQDSGIHTKILRLEDDADETRIPPPIVYGEVKSKSNPNGRTILFYNHYDVQPVEPLGLWNRHPFSGDISEGSNLSLYTHLPSTTFSFFLHSIYFFTLNTFRLFVLSDVLLAHALMCYSFSIRLSRLFVLLRIQQVVVGGVRRRRRFCSRIQTANDVVQNYSD
jgi:hypothetical protein